MRGNRGSGTGSGTPFGVPPHARASSEAGGAPKMLETCWQMLRPGGRLVANVVTAEGEQRLLAWQAANGGELLRIEVARLDALGSYHTWRPSLPVTQLAAYKP